jgi:hypothetical protein
MEEKSKTSVSIRKIKHNYGNVRQLKDLPLKRKENILRNLQEYSWSSK